MVLELQIGTIRATEALDIEAGKKLKINLKGVDVIDFTVPEGMKLKGSIIITGTLISV